MPSVAPPDPLFVLLGAGFSRDCATYAQVAKQTLTPPLVVDLFDQRFDHILRQYPIAQGAAAQIRQARALGEAVTLERFIAERYRDSSHRNDRRKFLALPYYFQHVLY